MQRSYSCRYLYEYNIEAGMTGWKGMCVPPTDPQIRDQMVHMEGNLFTHIPSFLNNTVFLKWKKSQLCLSCTSL